jgi:hypothetical protein
MQAYGCFGQLLGDPCPVSQAKGCRGAAACLLCCSLLSLRGPSTRPLGWPMPAVRNRAGTQASGRPLQDEPEGASLEALLSQLSAAAASSPRLAAPRRPTLLPRGQAFVLDC